VEKVDNQIKVLPLSPNDDRLRVALYRAIYGHPSLNRYALAAVPSIHIIVENGNVTLDGVVSNDGDRSVANMQANGVSGVFGVTNNLRIDNGK
ncbi:MAG TPA: BON domain-containing protein, partial [Bryobacteraceae bacterium]|nr:BON domain-containing protein [Bryobacteraceae bacterium]